MTASALFTPKAVQPLAANSGLEPNVQFQRIPARKRIASLN
jgi:hypothetical protein